MKRPVMVLLGVLIVGVALCSCKKEMFYGEWRIKGVAAYNRIHAWSPEAIEAVVGKEVTYSTKSATFGDDVCRPPYYLRSVQLRKEFERRNYVSFEQLGIAGDSVVVVHVFADKARTDRWWGIGSTFFIRDENTLLTPWDGAYFELTRVR